MGNRMMAQRPSKPRIDVEAMTAAADLWVGQPFGPPSTLIPGAPVAGTAPTSVGSAGQGIASETLADAVSIGDALDALARSRFRRPTYTARNESPAPVKRRGARQAKSVGVSTPSFVMRLKDCEAVNKGERIGASIPAAPPSGLWIHPAIFPSQSLAER